MNNNNGSTRSEQYARWLTRNRWIVIIVGILAIVFLAQGLKKLKMNTSLRIWFNEGSPEVLSYDNFTKRFSQDDAVAILFEDEKGIVNNDSVAIIQRLTKKFWQTKYVYRVDSLSNYAHTYVNGNNLKIQDLIEIKRPDKEKILKIITPYLSEGKSHPLFQFMLGELALTQPDKVKKYFSSNLSKDDKAELTALVMTILQPFNKNSLEDFIKSFISNDEKLLDLLNKKFFVTHKELSDFLAEQDELQFNSKTELEELTQALLASKIRHKEMISQYCINKSPSDLLMQKLRHRIDKLPPSQIEILKLIQDKVTSGNPYPLIAKAIERYFPTYYFNENFEDWLQLNTLKKEDLANFTSDVFIHSLPLRKNEIKSFVVEFISKSNADAVFNEIYPLVSYSNEELKEKEQIAYNEKLVKGLLLSDNKEVSQILITPKLPDFAQQKNIDFLKRIKTILDYESSKSNIEFHVAGLPEMLGAFSHYIKKDYQKLAPLMLLLIFVTMFILLRSFFGTIIPMLIVLVSALGTMGISGFFGVELNNIIMMAPPVIISIGIATAIHILIHFFRHLRSGIHRHEAMIKSISINLLPVALTSVTTALGFLSLITSVAPPIRVLGIVASTGTILTFIICITILPAILMVIPFSRKVQNENKSIVTRWSDQLGHFVVGNRKVIFAVMVAFTLIIGYFISHIYIDNSPTKYFQEGTYFRDASDFADKHFKGSTIIEVSLDTRKADGVKEPAFLQAVEKLQQDLEKDKPLKVSHTSSLVDILKTVNRRLSEDKPEEYRIPNDRKLIAGNLFLYTQSVPAGRDLNNQLNVDQSAIRLTIRKEGFSSSETLILIEAIEKLSRKYLPNYDVQATGRTAIFMSTVPKVVSKMILGLALALTIITIIIGITFRSIKTALLSIIPNATPMLIMFGVIGLTGTEFNLGISMVATVALGIIVDDTIHFITKYKNARYKGFNKVESVYEVFHNVGGAIIFTTVILTFGFGIFMFSNFGINEKFGIFTALTMIFALIMDLFLLPAVLLIGVKKEEIDLKRSEKA